MFLVAFVFTIRFLASTSFDKYWIAAVKSADSCASLRINVHVEDSELSPDTLVMRVSTLDSSALTSPYSARSWKAPCSLETKTSNVKFLVFPFQKILSKHFSRPS